MLTLYDFELAPNPRRARIFLAEKNVNYKKVPINLRELEQFSETFKAVNPRCTLPTLVNEEGHCFPDTSSIAAYLEARFPEPPLLGRSAEDKGDVAYWQARIESDGLGAVAEAFRNSNPVMAKRGLPGTRPVEQIPALAERGLERAAAFLDDLNEHLAHREFIAANQFSIADITALVTVDFARVIKVQPSENKHPHLCAWRERMKQRPSMKA
ncbi:MAG: glutathione S-transferase N-terminal domain-containing protein [Bordetella sp.]